LILATIGSPRDSIEDPGKFGFGISLENLRRCLKFILHLNYVLGYGLLGLCDYSILKIKIIEVNCVSFTGVDDWSLLFGVLRTRHVVLNQFSLGIQLVGIQQYNL
jgi:hypothetical protein